MKKRQKWLFRRDIRMQENLCLLLFQARIKTLSTRAKSIWKQVSRTIGKFRIFLSTLQMSAENMNL